MMYTWCTHNVYIWLITLNTIVVQIGCIYKAYLRTSRDDQGCTVSSSKIIIIINNNIIIVIIIIIIIIIINIFIIIIILIITVYI